MPVHGMRTGEQLFELLEPMHSAIAIRSPTRANNDRPTTPEFKHIAL